MTMICFVKLTAATLIPIAMMIGVAWSCVWIADRKRANRTRKAECAG